MSRYDKFFIVIKFFVQIKCEVYFIQKGYYRFRFDIENVELLQREEIEIVGKKYEVLFEKKCDVEKFKFFVESFLKLENIKYVVFILKMNVFYVQMKFELDMIRKDVEKIVCFVNEKFKESLFFF